MMHVLSKSVVSVAVKYHFLMLLGVLGLSVAMLADSPGESEHTGAHHGMLAERGIDGLAQRLGAAILKLGDKDLKEAFAPIQIHPKMLEKMGDSAELKVLSQAVKTVESIDCVGFDMFSTEAVSFVYVFSTQHGPWTMKCNTYIYRGQFFISGFSLTTSWEEMEEILGKVNRLNPFLQITPKSTEENRRPDKPSASLKS